VRIYKKAFILILSLSIGVVSAQNIRLPQKHIFGIWISDKPLYNNTMEIELFKIRKYIELLTDTKKHKTLEKREGYFKMINDHIIEITVKQTKEYYRVEFIDNSMRFYLTTRNFKKSAPLLVAYTFIKVDK
jgi:hypothetical protein